MGIYPEKYTREYFTGVNKNGDPVGYGATAETDSEGIWQLRDHDRKILEAIDFFGKKVLDIGFGRGEAICYAYLSGAVKCVGVDFSEAAVELANELIKKRKLPEAQLFYSDATTFIREYTEKQSTNETYKFDIVIMLDFVEHIPRAELTIMLDYLKKIITPNAIIVLNTPAYKYDNDVIKNGYDKRNMEDCLDTSDIVPETKGMQCNKFTVISLQSFMSECGFLNISEAHYFVHKSIFCEQAETAEHSAYSERWRFACESNTPLKTEYHDDTIEFPYKMIETPAYHKFEQGNLDGLTLLLTKTYQESAFPGGNYDSELFAAVKQEDMDNKIIFDVGAFMAVNSLLFAKLSGPKGKVFAFEPNPWNRNRTLLNLSHNKDLAQQIKVYDYALGDINDITSMTMSSEIEKGYSSTSRIGDSHPTIANEGLPQGFFDEEIKIRTLDWFVETSGIVPDVIKVDIEGAEHLLLRGGLKTLQKNKPILYIELHSEFCALQCTLLLQNLGYQIFVIKEEIDNRLMIKAVHISPTKNLSLHQNRNLDVFSYQYDIVLQTQKIINKELSTARANFQALQTEHQTLQGGYQALQKEHQFRQAEYQALQTEHQALLNSKTIKYSNKLKRTLAKLGVSKYKQVNMLLAPRSDLQAKIQQKINAPVILADLAPYVKQMAQTGEGTDACLKLGCLPVLVHFYSPIPDIYDLIQRDIWNKVSDLAGINFDTEKQVKLLLELGKEFGKECDWPLEKTSDPYQFYLNNNCFSYGCAASLHCMIRQNQPSRIIEIGSGNSSRVISAALTQNKKVTPNHFAEYIIVDPYPDETALSGLPNLTRIEKERVELLPQSFFDQLKENDILFIDSSHSVKIGSDVNYLILEILPHLAAGVIIHFHDIPLPYEYPKVYSTSSTFRMFWTESYLLQAFLSFNNDFEILLGMAYLMQNNLDKFCEAFPCFNLNNNESSAGSFWIRRKS